MFANTFVTIITGHSVLRDSQIYRLVSIGNHIQYKYYARTRAISLRPGRSRPGLRLGPGCARYYKAETTQLDFSHVVLTVTSHTHVQADAITNKAYNAVGKTGIVMCRITGRFHYPVPVPDSQETEQWHRIILHINDKHFSSHAVKVHIASRSSYHYLSWCEKVTASETESGCPCQTSTVPKILSALSCGVVDST